MSRLADYFVIIGYDHDKERTGQRTGKILQRFPQSDWPDTPFIEGIEWFCQPLGWTLSTERQEPKFFTSVLTDIDANRHYCACLCFNETVAITPSKPVDEDEDQLPSTGSLVPVAAQITHHSLMYAPKCLVLVSRLEHIETFRNCLGTIYTVHIESLAFPLETLIGNILGCIRVPAAGGPQVRFSIGAGDKQALQPALSATLPVTGTCVNFLFEQLGIRNVLMLFCAVMTEHKILFHSKSFTRLTDSCRALTALMYPFRYGHVYIPILPASLVEVLSTPTPFIMGVHSSLQGDIHDLADVIVVDIDGGAIRVPEMLVPPLSVLPPVVWEATQHALQLVLQPQLTTADLAFSANGPNGSGPAANSTKPPAMRDKEIRAVFMRMLAQLLQGYRSCLTLIRIHPKPVITFHKAGFLGARDLVGCDFLLRVLDSMFFTGFVTERGAPWRPCDAWDELYSSIGDHGRGEAQDARLVLAHIQDLAQILYTNENPNTLVYAQKVLRPPDGAYSRIHQPTMAEIDAQRVQAIIGEGLQQNERLSATAAATGGSRAAPRIVPMGPHLQSISDGRPIVSHSARRLEVLKTCVACIFDNKIADARKSFPAVLRMLKQRDARLTLCRELARTVQGNKAMLEHLQFDLVVKLMNRALHDDSPMDEHGVAAALLPLATAFCRKLCTGVIQFAYSCIQDHPVWRNQQFWEAAFYQDVQTQIKALYLPQTTPAPPQIENSYPYSWKRENNGPASPANPAAGGQSPDDFQRQTILSRVQEPSALEIAAEQMRLWPGMEATVQTDLGNSEESTLYSQAIHYANRMVSLLIPADVNGGGKVQRIDRRTDDDTSVSNSVAESRSHSEHSDEGFDEIDPGETGAQVAKLVCRFIDRVCTEGSVTAEHVRNLHAMVPGVVHMHIETLDAIQRESKRIVPVPKAKIQKPVLLHGERYIGEPMRVYLLADGREEGTMSALLPAEGALFLTNYRLVFRGSPCDPLACERSVVRAFPVASLTKEKRISVLYLPHLDQVLPEGLQLRSCTFQLLKVAFDEELTNEQIETFRKLMNKTRHPTDEFGHFAFSSQSIVHALPMQKVKEKNATLRVFAKKTLMRTAKRAGFKQKSATKQKYVLSGADFEGSMSSMSGANGQTSPSAGGGGLLGANSTTNALDGGTTALDDGEDSDDAAETMPRLTVKDVERLKERSYVKDWQRLGFGDAQSNFRISSVNCNYSLCRTYPAILLAPSVFSDDSLRSLAKSYKNQRIACATWRHRNGAVLLRGAMPVAKGVMNMLKGHPNASASSSAEPSLSGFQEQDRYFVTIIENMPNTITWRKHRAWGLSDSSLSINSLMQADEQYQLAREMHATPEAGRKQSSNAFNNTVRSFTGTNRPLSQMPAMPSAAVGQSTRNTKYGSLKSGLSGNLSAYAGGSPAGALRDVHDQLDGSASASASSAAAAAGPLHYYHLQRVPLYILGEKSHSKSVRLSEMSTGFIPVDYSDWRHSRNAFKKLTRACLPSTIATEPDQTFAKLLEQSEWLQQIRDLLQLSGAVVDLIDLQASSVTLALEDGTDVTAQVSSLAQLCLDPHYRTIEGFRVLIEKEWLAFGHRFGQHNNTKAHSSSGSSFTPVFLQFLDAVHQIQAQFPLAFEFNEYYLRFLAYHSVSARFRTFLFNCELERFDLGLATLDDKRGSLNSKHVVVEACNASDDDSIYPGGIRSSSAGGSAGRMGSSLFDYIDRQHVRAPVFYNFMYASDPDRPVLRPQSSLAVLELWRYYVDEELADGPAYDPELVSGDPLEDEADVTPAIRRPIIAVGYDCLAKCEPNVFARLLDDLRNAESERGLLPQKWRQVWDKLELPHSDSLTRHASFSSALVRSHGRLLHKRSTLEILMRGRLIGHSTAGHQESFAHPHRFDKHLNTPPMPCDLCERQMWTGQRCKDCGQSFHDKCTESVPKNCTKYKAAEGVTQTMTRSGQGDNGSIASSANTGQASSQHVYEQFSSNVAENRTHEGHLYKRGALLKGWKQRWFVLDSIKHQLRYYDGMEDSNPRGVIELADVQSVAAAPPAQVGNSTKKIDEKAFFDLKTSRRTYNFYAVELAKAQEWIEKIQACLQ